MKRIIILLICAALFLVAVPSFAANTTVIQDGTISIVLDGTTDWIASVEFAAVGINAPKRITSIQFNPSAASDVLIIRGGSITGIPVFNSGPTGGTAPVIKYYPPEGKRVNLYIDATDLVLTTPANAVIYIEFEN